MDFHLTREQEMVRKMYREFAENEVKPLAEELDEEERFPMETVEKMGKLGMMGIYFPKKYGGAGGDVLSYAMCVEELSKVCGTTGVIVSAHTSLCCAPIYEHGTEEQKMKYLPDLLSGKKIGAFGLTEPNAGTDASGQQTTAVKNENGDYVLNGSKCFITNGTVAGTIVVFAMTDQKAGNHGISAFIVEKDFPGFSTGKHEKKMGIRGSSTCDLIFEDCVVPKENLLGKEGPVKRRIAVPDSLIGHGGKPLPGLDVPLAPVAEAPQLHIADETVGPQPLSHRPQQPLVGGKKHRVSIVRRIALSVGDVVPAAGAGLFIEPVRDVEMCFVPRLVAGDAQHQMDTPRPQFRQMTGLLDGLPGVGPLFGFQLPPGQAQIAQGGTLGAAVQHTGRIADLRIGEGALVRQIGHGPLPPRPDQAPGQQQAGGRRSGVPLSHDILRCTGSWSRPPRPRSPAAGR